MSRPEDTPERKAAWAIYFARCDETNRLAQNFEEEEVIDLLARAILAAKAEGEIAGREAMRAANQLIRNKSREANEQRGRALQAKAEAERRERAAYLNRDEWKERALSAEAHLHSLGHVNTAHKNKNEMEA